MKVRVLPCQPHSLVFGGFEIQMLSVVDAVRELGVDVAPLDVWSQDGAFDILHLWGLEDAHLPSVMWGRLAGKRIVMSVLLPYVTPKALARNLAGRMLGIKRIQRKLLSLVDRLVVVNREQGKTAERLLGFPGERISIIPNIIEDMYFKGEEEAGLSEDFGIDNYIVCTGNICRRKSQLMLAQAAIDMRIPLLIVGRVLTGEEDYSDALGRLIRNSSNVRWVAGLPPHSHALRAAYRKSAAFVLVSVDETQPISALEAAAMGKPILLSDSPWARQSFYRGAYLVNPRSFESIKDGIRRVMNQPDRFTVRPEELEQCRRRSVGKAYAEAYAQTMAGDF
jgi:glycosyltransferase involved in cell wall biosynthesis